MKKLANLAVFLCWVQLFSCTQASNNPSPDLVNEIDLKRGEVISCGAPGNEFGALNFEISCGENVKEDFNLAIKLLHSFEYDEAEKVFAKIIDKEPGCAMAYWGVAMANFHPLWTAPSEAELKKGLKAIRLAQSLKTTGRESAYIAAIASFYQDWENKDHRSRCLEFEKGMEKLYTEYPGDKEAAVLYALALDASADPGDKTFSKQKKAGAILNGLYPGQPNHPGIAHYIIHTYDYPGLAELGLDAARKYASVAPSSAHALHMPSHIFTRLGLWDECIQSNIASVASAKCYAEAAGIKGHWDEELHGLDYLVYAYLQKGATDSASRQLDYLKTIKEVRPLNFKVAYAFASIPSRYALENNLWEQAARLEAGPEHFPWKNYPWQEAIVHFTRLLGAANTGNLTGAGDELTILNRLHDTLVHQKEQYKASQVAIQVKAGEAWLLLKQGKNNEALKLMELAADMEDKTEKHPVTPGVVIPARELLGDMLLQLNQPVKALEAYEACLQKNPNRFKTVYGAGLAAEISGNKEKATNYYRQLLNTVGNTHSARPELALANNYLKG